MNPHPEYPLDPSPTAEPVGPGTEARPSGSLVVRSYQDALGIIADLRASMLTEAALTRLADQNTAAQEAFIASFAPPRPNRRQRRAIKFGRLK